MFCNVQVILTLIFTVLLSLSVSCPDKTKTLNPRDHKNGNNLKKPQILWDDSPMYIHVFTFFVVDYL